MNKIAMVVGARPNFMKVAPLMRAVKRDLPDLEQYLIHTGQHYDANMSKIFFEDLALPVPDVYLGVGAGSQADQTARVMMEIERVVMEQRPDWLFVVGDVNSTMAAALVAAKLHIPVAHLEAGLRSFDREMPEEINRIVTDAIADLLLTSCRDGDENLLNEGVPREKIRFVGNIMIDTLVAMLEKSRSSTILSDLGLEPNRFVAVTLHRPSNVDEPEKLRAILGALEDISRDLPVIFPVHPRTKKNMDAVDWTSTSEAFRTVDPLGYLDFLHLTSHAAIVVTDSGGIQEETSYLGIPCITVRDNTERPITVTQGTNRLVAGTREAITAAAAEARTEIGREPPVIELWDGHTAERIVEVIKTL